MKRITYKITENEKPNGWTIVITFACSHQIPFNFQSEDACKSYFVGMEASPEGLCASCRKRGMP